MNHKHIQVIMEDHDFTKKYDTWEVINDLADYMEHVEKGTVDKHYENCIAESEELPELTDTQIALIIKAALEYNASIIAGASSIFKQDVTQKTRKRLKQDFLRIAKQYDKHILTILKMGDNDSNT